MKRTHVTYENPESNSVSLVLDRNAGERLHAIAEMMPVWVISSEHNCMIVEQLRQRLPRGRLTLFLPKANESCDDELARAVYAIDEHHGASSELPPYFVLHVYGASARMSPAMAEELGFHEVVETSEGFCATKLHET
jgi:hypothetical protein